MKLLCLYGGPEAFCLAFDRVWTYRAEQDPPACSQSRELLQQRCEILQVLCGTLTPAGSVLFHTSRLQHPSLSKACYPLNLSQNY